MADRPQLAIAVYHAMEAKEEEFFSLIRAHWPVLWRRGLVSPRRPLLGRSLTTPGVFVETFEWKSAASVDRAHRDPEVQRIWNAMAAIWQKPSATLAKLPECQGQFAHFAMLDVKLPLAEQKEGKKKTGKKGAAEKPPAATKAPAPKAAAKQPAKKPAKIVKRK